MEYAKIAVGDEELQTIKRRSDEPKLDIGATVALKDGRGGVVVARYTPSAHPDEVRYVVQVQTAKHKKHSK